MKPCPTSSPTNRSSSQNARAASSSRNSLASSCGKLCEGKEDFLQPAVDQVCLCPQLAETALGDLAAVVQKHQAIANLCGIIQLVNRKHQRPSGSALTLE